MYVMWSALASHIACFSCFSVLKPFWNHKFWSPYEVNLDQLRSTFWFSGCFVAQLWHRMVRRAAIRWAGPCCGWSVALGLRAVTSMAGGWTRLDDGETEYLSIFEYFEWTFSALHWLHWLHFPRFSFWEDFDLWLAKLQQKQKRPVSLNFCQSELWFWCISKCPLCHCGYAFWNSRLLCLIQYVVWIYLVFLVRFCRQCLAQTSLSSSLSSFCARFLWRNARHTRKPCSHCVFLAWVAGLLATTRVNMCQFYL